MQTTMNDKRFIESRLREVREFIKSTEVAFPNRGTLLALLGAAIAINARGKVGKRFGEFNEFKLHLDDALEPLDLRIEKIRRPRGRPSGRTGHARNALA